MDWKKLVRECAHDTVLNVKFWLAEGLLASYVALSLRAPVEEISFPLRMLVL